MRLHDSGAEASFCIFFAPVANCIFTVWVPPCEEKCRCPEECNPFGSGFPIGASSTLLAHDFARQSLVCLYLLRPLTLERGCHRTGQTVSCGSRRTNICRHGRLADIRSSGVGDAAKRRLEAEAVLHRRGSKRYINPAAATHFPKRSSLIHPSFRLLFSKMHPMLL